MNIAQEPVFLWLAQFAYQPQLVYLATIGMMLASSVGFPLPEEVTLLSVGFLAYMGAHPEKFPPPYPGAPVVNVHEAALVAFFAVFFADFIIYTIGKIWGRRIVEHPKLKKFFPDHLLIKVESWTKKYGAFAVFVFRFTPGIRFPGHIACGILKVETWKFLLIDGFAAGISVPTQIYLLAYLGEPIIEILKEFKLVVLGIFVVGFLVWLIRKFFWKRTSLQG